MSYFPLHYLTHTHAVSFICPTVALDDTTHGSTVARMLWTQPARASAQRARMTFGTECDPEIITPLCRRVFGMTFPHLVGLCRFVPKPTCCFRRRAIVVLSHRQSSSSRGAAHEATAKRRNEGAKQ